MTSRARERSSRASSKIATGISGFDEISRGGLPRGRVTVILGGPGCGKTIFALQSLASEARHGGAGLFVAFEESPAQILEDAKRFDWKLSELKGPISATNSTLGPGSACASAMLEVNCASLSQCASSTR